MELRKKLKDQSGASILLALLFFLLCAMVGASVLMAAVSNAGKIKSNREEQQKYLLLSSALRLVCDELTEGSYTGKYSQTPYTVVVPKKDADGNVMKDADGNVMVDYTYTYHKYEQEQGTFNCGLSEVLPLLPELDWIFSQTFETAHSGNDDYVFPNSFSADANKPGKQHELTLSVENGPDGLKDTVTVEVRLDKDLFIWLTATLGEKDDVYTMEAQLTHSGDLPDVEKGRASVEWTLALIAKKVAGNEEAGDGT